VQYEFLAVKDYLRIEQFCLSLFQLFPCLNTNPDLRAMQTSLWMMLFHLFGFGLVSTLLVMGWLLLKQYHGANDYKSKLVVLSTARVVGILSPIAILVLLITGIGNMHARGLGFFDENSEPWLNIKIILFAIAAINGTIFGMRSKNRGMLVAQLAQGNAPPESESKLASFDKGVLVFNIVQTILLIAILVFTVWKPGRFSA
jgi:hypothetical protein